MIPLKDKDLGIWYHIYFINPPTKYYERYMNMFCNILNERCENVTSFI